jgi:PAS domain S-box-containing protein
MKTTSERRLLFALLLSSLVPLVALGVLSAAGIHRLGQAVDSQVLETRMARTREALGTACRDAIERLETFFARREAELRSLALVSPTAGAYRSFQRTALSPLWDAGKDGRRTRVWAPLYEEVRFVAPSGGDVAVGPDHPKPAEPSTGGGARPSFVEAALRGPADEVSVRLAPDIAPAALRFSLALRGPTGTPKGVVSVVIGPRHLEEQLHGNSPFPEATERWTLFLFDGDTPVIVPSAVGGSEDDDTRRAVNVAAAGIRGGRNDVVSPSTESAPWLAYSPLFFAADSARAGAPAGGVVLRLRDVPRLGENGSAAFAERAEMRIGLLTLVAAFGVALSALLVARRMALPWVRLREKARAVSAEAEGSGDEDDLDAIVRSFDTLASQLATSAGLARASEERLREFLELSPDGIAVVDLDGRFLHFNRALCQTLRRPPNQVAALQMAALFAHPGDGDELLSRLREAEWLRNHEAELLRGDGSSFPALLSVRLGRFEGTECLDIILRDVADWKEAHRRDRENTEALFRVYGELNQAHKALRRAYTEVEEQVRLKTSELRGAYEALQASDQIKTEFLMRMSHELRTPLNCIIGYSEALGDGLDGPVTPEQAESLSRIAQSGRRLLRMIEDLLDLSRLEAGRLDLRCGNLVLVDVLNDVVHQTRNLVGAKPLHLELVVDPGLPAVWADGDRVRQVLFNLVGNAVKFTAEGWVRVQARRADPSSVEVRVTDTGPGIDAEHQERIFEKFTQVPGTSRGGTGLGLAISREIVERMGGRVWVESSAGRGSCFGFTLPLAGTAGQLALPLGSATPPATG